MSALTYLCVRWEVSKSEFFTKKIISWLISCLFSPQPTAEIGVVHGSLQDLWQLLQPTEGDSKGLSTTRLREVPGCACFSCHLSLFLLSLTRSLKCREGVEVVQPPDWLSPSRTERGNEKGFPPCPFPNLQHRGLLVPVLVPSWWGRGCPCSLWWLLGSGTWDSCKSMAVCGSDLLLCTAWSPRLSSAGTLHHGGN